MAVLTVAVLMLLWAYLLVTMAVLSLAVVTVAYLPWPFSSSTYYSDDPMAVPSIPGAFLTLRVFRVLRPLRTIKRIQGLRILVVSLLKSLPMLLNILVPLQVQVVGVVGG